MSEGAACLFVYGSLMLGEENHGVLRGARWLGVARTESRYTLCDLGEYPAMIEGGVCSVVGELYEVDAATLIEIDRLEGHPVEYQRVAIVLASGALAQAYVMDAGTADRYPRVASGDWRARRPVGGSG